jgi:UDP-glucose 4-epimerase
MRILVTGGAGFIGTHLCNYLITRGDQVHVVDNYSTGSPKNLPHGVSVVKGDIEHMSSMDLGGYDEVYHLAAAVGVHKILNDPLGCVHTNIEGTKNILEALIDLHAPPKLFFASTSEVYGKAYKDKMAETDDRITGSIDKLRWVYAATKEMDEFLCNIYARQYNLSIVIGRLFSIVGPGQSGRYGMVMPRFAEQARKNEPITVYGDGSQIRSFMYVQDLVHCITSVMSRHKSGCDLVNFGNPEPIMIKDLAWRIKSLFNSDSPIQFTSYEEAYGKDFEDMSRRVPDISKLMSYVPNLKLTPLDDIIHTMRDERGEESC